jgi:hypothetical protein
VDSIGPKRGGQTHTIRLITCLTGLIDDIHSNRNLTIMAATNRLEDVDPSLRRPGRLDREVKNQFFKFLFCYLSYLYFKGSYLRAQLSSKRRDYQNDL